MVLYYEWTGGCLDLKKEGDLLDPLKRRYFAERRPSIRASSLQPRAVNDQGQTLWANIATLL